MNSACPVGSWGPAGFPTTGPVAAARGSSGRSPRGPTIRLATEPGRSAGEARAAFFGNFVGLGTQNYRSVQTIRMTGEVMVLSEIHDYFGVSNGNIQPPKNMNKKETERWE